MKMVRVTGREITVRCMACTKAVRAGDGHDTMADLDGPAFKAYYCKPCSDTKRLAEAIFGTEVSQ